MGRFIYDATTKVDFDDRVLAHLQFVITDKLRRSEPFSFSWREDASVGEGRTTVWVHAHASLVFRFSGSRRPSLNRDWLEALARTANSPGGLHVVPEPVEGLSKLPDKITEPV